MSALDQHSSGLELPAPVDAERAVKRAMRIYHRTLASWASDMLVLRRANMLGATWSPPEEDIWSMAA